MYDLIIRNARIADGLGSALDVPDKGRVRIAQLVVLLESSLGWRLPWLTRGACNECGCKEQTEAVDRADSHVFSLSVREHAV